MRTSSSRRATLALPSILIAASVSVGVTRAAISPVARSARPDPAPAPAGSGSAAVPAPVGADSVQARAASLVAEALKVPAAYVTLGVLTDTIGHRLAGSAAEPKAVAWAKRAFEAAGVRVRLEPVKVPVWIRGSESAEIVSPFPQPLFILGLGGTVPTPAEGITAPVVVVASYDELAALGRVGVAGKIVLFDNPFVRTGDELHDYGEAVKFRSGGPSAAAKLGAAGVLVRSVATASLRSPHTGATSYRDDSPRIPAAAVTIEDASLIHRLSAAGHEVRVRLFLGAHTEPDRDGANVVAEIVGRQTPGEVVLIGAHLDSWDVGMGAIDDGAGCAMVIETMRLLASGPPPRRTVRAVLYANEENGLRGGKGYAAAHAAELDRHVAAIEADSGGGRALGLDLRAGEGGVERLRALLVPVLAPIGAARIQLGEGGADTSALEDAGVPQIGLALDTTRYFEWHHTWADTLDKIEPTELQQATAALAATTWVLAETTAMLPRFVPEPKKP